MLSRTFTPPHPTDLRATLSPLWRGRRDRAMWFGRTPTEGVWRATHTPTGPGTQHLSQYGDDITVRACGPGAEWLIDHAPVIVGANDNDGGFTIDRTRHELLYRTWKLHRGVRVTCTHAVWEILFRVIIEQKVTGKEARDSFIALQRVLGKPAPTAPGVPALTLPPSPVDVANAPGHVFMAANVERKRADTIKQAASYAHRLDQASPLALAEAYRRLAAIPGIGVWTINEVGVIALGDCDAVSVGDYHLKNWVSWALAGEPRGTDDRMVELLEPYRPHRARMMRIIGLAGLKAPRYGPRLTIQRRF
jgi:3-methyladenine DNA glycosylase/8-oxoguanine DNA glycosylase